MNKHSEEDTSLTLPKGLTQSMTRLNLGSHLIKSAVVESMELLLSNIVQTTSKRRISLTTILEALYGRELSHEDLDNAESNIRNHLAFAELADSSDEVLRLQYDALISLACIYLLKGQKVQAKVITSRARVLFADHSVLSVSDDVKNILEKLVNAKSIT